jgi:uncharacterized protein YraI
MRLPLALSLLALALPTLATAAEPTARVSGNIAVREGPGNGYATIGRLRDGDRVTLEYCTRDDRWCFVSDTGWVNASYLVGWTAKIPVTPFSFIGGDTLRPNDRDHDFGW